MSKIKKRLILGTLLSTLLAVNSWANFEQAMNSYERQDYLTASSEFKKLAAQGDADAQYMLGYMYAVGKGLIQDYVEAHKWFNLAASRGNTDALKARTAVEHKMTREQISLAQKKARDWKPQRYQAPVLTEKQLMPAVQSEPELKDRHSIAATQSQLTQLGYQPGPVDGAMGKKTRNAIRQYQQDQQLNVDGRITQKLLKSLYPEGVPDRPVTSTAGNGLLFPEIWEQRTASEQTNEQQLKTELQQLIAKGRQQQAAQEWFLDELAALIAVPSSNGSKVILDENFSDGNYTYNPRWTVISGQFSVGSSGLHSSTVSQAVPQRKNTRRDISTAILGVILEQATGTGNRSGGSNNTNPAQAKILTEVKIPASFAMNIKLSLASRQGRIELGPYIDNSQQQAYQLLILPEQGQVQLLRVNAYKSAVIESAAASLPLNKTLTFEWLKDKDGVMTVALNGQQLFQVTDRQYQQAFKGFMLNNYAGTINLQSLKIMAK